MRLISSETALAVIVALAAADSLTLSGLSRAVGAPTSSTKRALEILEEDGVVIRSGHTYSRGRVDSPTAALVLQLAQELLHAEDIVRIVARAADQVEFVGRDEHQLLVLFGRGSDPLVESRLARVFERQSQRLGIELRLLAHDDVRRELDTEPARRDAYLRFHPLFGDPDVAFPDRSLHGTTTGERLGRPNPLLRRPSARALHRLRSRHGIRSAKIFGSAVRSDFRPDSDVDVAIDVDRPPTLRDLIAIEQAFEQLFERDVDVVLQGNARPGVRDALEQ